MVVREKIKVREHRCLARLPVAGRGKVKAEDDKEKKNEREMHDHK